MEQVRNASLIFGHLCEKKFAYLHMSWTQRGDDIDGLAAGNRAGYAVAISRDGLVMAIGAPYANNSTGSVRTFRWSGSSWTQTGALTGNAESDAFGSSVSLSSDGSVMIVGGPNAAKSIGYARVYDWNGSQWMTKGREFTGEATDDRFGCSVSISSDGNMIAIGAYGTSSAMDNAGQVSTFEWEVNVWNRKGFIDGEYVDDRAGTSVSLNADGTVVAIGAPRYNVDTDKPGYVRVYQMIDQQWQKRGESIEGPSDNSANGESLALNDAGNVLVIGSPWHNALNGIARVFVWTDRWTQRGAGINGSNGNNYGKSVSISADGNTISIGTGWNDAVASHAGMVQILTWKNNVWEQKGTSIYGKAGGDYAGNAISMDGTGELVAIGAAKADGNGTGTSAGQVRVFAYHNTLVRRLRRTRTRNLQNYRKRTGGRYTWRNRA